MGGPRGLPPWIQRLKTESRPEPAGNRPPPENLSEFQDEAPGEPGDPDQSFNRCGKRCQRDQGFYEFCDPSHTPIDDRSAAGLQGSGQDPPITLVAVVPIAHVVPVPRFLNQPDREVGDGDRLLVEWRLSQNPVFAEWLHWRAEDGA